MKKLWEWIKLWFWTAPTETPKKEPPLKIKATEVAHAYMVVQYHGQMINMLKDQYPTWKAMSRFDKRAMADRFKNLQKKGLIRFEEIEGKMICIRNKDYQSIADERN